MLGDGIGYHVARELRTDPKLFAVPILFMSAASDERDVSYALTQGGDAYLSKPFSFGQFSDSLNRLVQLREETRRLCETTHLPGLAAMKRQINHRLLAGAPTALCCIQVNHLEAYHSRRGNTQWREAMALISRVLVNEVRRFGGPGAYLAHTFGGTFLALVGQEAHQQFASHLVSVFGQQVRPLHTENELLIESMILSGQAPESETSQLLTVHVSVVHTAARHFSDADHMLAQLAEAHQLVAQCRGNAVFIDRKHDHPPRLPGE